MGFTETNIVGASSMAGLVHRTPLHGVDGILIACYDRDNRSGSHLGKSGAGSGQCRNSQRQWRHLQIGGWRVREAK